MSLSVSDVRDEARAVLREELEAFARAQPSPVAAERFGTLAAAVGSGDVPDELVPALETFLELALYRGRLRRSRGAEADDALGELFFRTPSGAASRKAAHEVTRALGALAGQPIDRINVVATIGGHSVEIRTDQAQVTLELDRGGARVKSLEVGA